MKQQKVELGESTATVKELTVRDVRNIMSNMKEVFSSDEIQMQDIITDKLDSILELASDVVSFSDGRTLLDLTFSEIELLIPVILEVNQSFFGQMAALGIIPVPQLEQGAPSE